jgi:hypothetical protein
VKPAFGTLRRKSFCEAAAAARAASFTPADGITFPKTTCFHAGMPSFSVRSARPFMMISSTATSLGHSRSHFPQRRQSDRASCNASALPSRPEKAASTRVTFPRATDISAFRSG